VKFRSLGRFSFARLLTLANVVFWVVFAVFFVVKAFPYQPHKPVFEERSPEFIYFGRALSILENEQVSPLMKTTLLVQKPSFYAARPFFWYFNSRGITADRQYRGVSVGGYYLLLVCLLSFLQWYLAGFLIDFLRRRLSTGPNHTSGNPGDAYDARK
jgi:hypothetical protein